MGGSTIFETIWNNYNTAALAALHSTLGSMIPVVAAAMGGILSLMVLIAGKNLMFDELPMGEAVTRGVRALVISALLVAGTFNTYVTTFLTQTLPQQLAQTVGTGSGTASGASSFDTMVDTLTKLGLQAQAQMVGLQYLGYQVAEWLIEAAAKVFVAMAFLVWMLASLEVMFFLPVIVLVLPAWLFERTRAWGERSVGFILGLILTGTLVLMVANVFITQETHLMAQFANTATSPSANPSSLAALLGSAGVNSPITGQSLGGGGSTLNGASAVETMISMLITLVAGFLVLATTSVVALLVMASGGFSAGGVISAVANAITRGLAAATRAGRGRAAVKP
jgi:TrbL/VirB6 plasmid conjugal transfer protein